MSEINMQSIGIFHQVDNFIRTLITRNISVNQMDLNKITLELNRLHQPFFRIFSNEYWYSNTIQAFVVAIYSCIGEVPTKDFVWQTSSTAKFLYYLLTYEKMVRYSLDSQINQEMNNRYELEQYVRRVLNNYAKSLVIFITLSYQHQWREKVSLEDFQNQIDNFRDLISNKKTCFKDLVGYAWAIEQGIEKGYHCHLWLAYDGSKRQSDFYIGKEVGEKWVKITNGLGEYHNSNNPETKYSYQQHGRLGIGRIHRNNLHEIENAVSTALYLTEPHKCNQYLVVKPSGMKTFGKGVFR